MFPNAFPALLSLFLCYHVLIFRSYAVASDAAGVDARTAKRPSEASLRACAARVLGSDASSRLITKNNATYEDARLGEKIQ